MARGPTALGGGRPAPQLARRRHGIRSAAAGPRSPRDAKNRPHIVGGRLLTIRREPSSERLTLLRPAAQERQADQARPDQDEGHRFRSFGGVLLVPILLKAEQPSRPRCAASRPER